MKVRYSYSSTYNFRPDELYGMGKESLDIQSPPEGVPVEQFFKMMEHNSNLKHESHYEAIIGSDILFEREDWKRWVGQPMFYITNIKVEIIDEP